MVQNHSKKPLDLTAIASLAGIFFAFSIVFIDSFQQNDTISMYGGTG